MWLAMCAGEGAAQAACAMPMAIIVDDRLDVSSPSALQTYNDKTCCTILACMSPDPNKRDSVLHFEASLPLCLAFGLFWHCYG